MEIEKTTLDSMIYEFNELRKKVEQQKKTIEELQTRLGTRKVEVAEKSADKVFIESLRSIIREEADKAVRRYAGLQTYKNGH